VLSAHRGLAKATLFTHLDKVGVGDRFAVNVLGETMTYQVITTQVVDPDDTEALRIERGKDLVTLVTCTPLGINTSRIIVTGQRVYPTPKADIAAAKQAPRIPPFPWWDRVDVRNCCCLSRLRMAHGIRAFAGFSEEARSHWSKLKLIRGQASSWACM
jgi:hypothetical protein